MPTQLPPTRRTFIKSASASVALAGLGTFVPVSEVHANEAQAAAITGVNEAASKANQKKPLDVVIFLYDRMTALDAIGPYEVMRLVPDARVRFAAKKAGLIRTDSRLQMLNADHAIADIDTADILIVPGGDAAGPLQDKAVLEWVARMHEKTKWTTSVCVGSIILGAAGLLKGLKATSHWNVLEGLKMFGAEPVHERFVRQGKIITAAGVSAGIDMALALVELERNKELAQTIQLLIEYDPHPPFNTGSVAKATPAMVEEARKMLRIIYAPETP